MPGGGPLGATSFVGTKVFGSEGAKVEDSWGANLHKLVDRRFNHMMVYGIIGEDLPEKSNRVLASWRAWLLANSRSVALIALMVIGALLVVRGAYDLGA